MLETSGSASHSRTPEFGDGFMFALHVLSSMGHQPRFGEIMAQLHSVAMGDLTLMATPEEAIRDTEQGTGREMPDKLKSIIRRLLGNRASVDSSNRASAIFILREFGFGDVPDPS